MAKIRAKEEARKASEPKWDLSIRLNIGRLARVATKLWWLFVDQNKSILPLKFVSKKILYSYVGTFGPISEEDILKCIEILLDHLVKWLQRRVVGGEVYIRKKENFTVQQVTEMLEDLKEKYL